MKLRFNIYTIASVAFSIITLIFFLVISKFFDETLIFYLGLPFALSAFLFSHMFLCHDSAVWSFKIAHAQIPNIILDVITIVSVFAVLFVPVYNGSILEWANIPLINWLRYVASIFLTMFLPGYFLLKIIDSKNSIGVSATIPLAYVLSMFITFITGFCLLLTNNSISVPATFLLILVNLTLMTIYFVRSFSKNFSQTIMNLNLIEAGALIATLVVVIVGNIYVMNNTLPLSGGDMWRHLTQALQYSKGFPVHEGRLIPDYPYLFHVFLATFFQISGLPSALSYQALFALSFIPILSFYSFIKGWFSKKNICSIAVLLIPLLGFGSLYTLRLKVQNPTITLPAAVRTAIRKTYDIMDIMVIGPSLSNVVPLLYIVLPTLFMFLCLLRKNMNSITKSFLCAVLVAVSFLGHISGSFFMGVFLLSYAIIIKEEDVKAVALGGILGLLIVCLVDFIAPVRLYIWGISGFAPRSTETFFATLLLFMLSYFTSVLVRRFEIKRNFFSDSFKKNAVSLTSAAIVLAYLFSLIAWLYFLPNYDAIKFGHYKFTPFFVWAIRFGPIGLLSILCLSLYLSDVVKDKSLTFFLTIAATGFAMEQIANYYPLYPAYRFAKLTLIGTVVLATYFVVKTSLLLARKKRLVFTALLIFVMIPGMLSSSLLYYNRGQLKPTISSDELDALSFVEQNLSSNSSVLTFTGDSQRKLETFASVNTLQIMQRWDYILLDTQDPSIFFYTLGMSDAKYAYLSQSDLAKLNDGELIRSFINGLPVAFSNVEVIIYELPNFSPPSPDAHLLFLDFFIPTQTFNLTSMDVLLRTLPSRLCLEYRVGMLPLRSTEERYNLTVLVDGEDIDEIRVSEGAGTILLEEDNVQGNTSIGAREIERDDRAGTFALQISGNWNLTNYEVMSLWIKIPENVTRWVKVNLRSSAQWATWRFSDVAPNSWVELHIPLKSPKATSEIPLNLSRIDRIDIGFYGIPNSAYNFFKVDYVTVFNPATYDYYIDTNLTHILENAEIILLPSDPTFNVSGLLPWIEKGGKLLVLGNEGEMGSFGQLLSLRCADTFIATSKIIFGENGNTSIPESQVSEIYLNDPQVTILASYDGKNELTSPFLMHKPLEKGGILYARLPSFHSTDLALNLTHLLQQILDFSDLNIQKSDYKKTYFPVYRTIEKETMINGSITVDTNHIFSQSMNVSKVEINASENTWHYENVTISLESVGNSVLTLNGSFRLSSVLPSSYLTISGDNSQFCSLRIQNGSLALKVLSKNHTRYIQTGTVTFNVSNFELHIREPTIDAIGTINFESARIPTILTPPSYTPLGGVARNEMHVDGWVKLKVLYASNGVTLISDFDYTGQIRTSTSVVQKFEIPWIDLFFSPLNIIMILLVMVGGYINIKYKIIIEFEKK